MKKPERFRMRIEEGGYIEPEPDSAGEWVRFDDIKHLLAVEPSGELSQTWAMLTTFTAERKAGASIEAAGEKIGVGKAMAHWFESFKECGCAPNYCQAERGETQGVICKRQQLNREMPHAQD
jgi:hypothetical protein